MHKMMTRFISLWALIFSLSGTAFAVGPNEDFEVEFKSHPWSLVSHFDVIRDGKVVWRASRDNLTSVEGFYYDLRDLDDASKGAMSSEWKDPSAIRHSTANLEIRDANGLYQGRLRGEFLNTQMLRMNIYDASDTAIGVVDCSITEWNRCDVKAYPDAEDTIAVMWHASWRTWKGLIQQDGIIEQNILEVIPLYLHDYLRAFIYYDVAFSGAGKLVAPIL